MQQYVEQNDIDESFYNGFAPRELIMNIKNNEDRFKTINRLILDYLELRKGSGATNTEIVKSLGIDRSTSLKHLTYLVATRQAYKINEFAHIYHKNGRIVHYKNMEKKIFDKKLYTFFQLQGLGEDQIYIQEKEKGKLQSVTVKGGIIIGKSHFRKFIDELKNFSEEIEASRT